MPIQTIASLRLDIAAARAGKTWLLLPEGNRELGLEYPLPSSMADLNEVASIPLPFRKQDDGCKYIRRARVAIKKRKDDRLPPEQDTAHRNERVRVLEQRMEMASSRGKQRIAAAIDEVRLEASRAVAGLNDLFALGREGLDGQMRAHLAGTSWHGEAITASAFRDCFRMVTQAVKGLGLPSDQRERASEAIMDEVATSLKQTQEAQRLQTAESAAPPPAPETEH